MQKFELRWAQLDVARQMESIPFIEQFIDLLSASGYNGLLLYLEDRIRTQSYQYPADNECYTPDEIRHIIDYAAKRNMEIIPCVATLGHAERFLRHKELEHLAELQGDMLGRFENTTKLTFCVTHPEFYDFIGTYLSEVADLFPSTWFHVGLDEFWDYNLCPRCKKRMPDNAAEQQVFLEHILKVREILAAKGKQIMMWSDMFEYYADIFTQVPADVMMIDWQYQADVRQYLGHLLDIAVEDRMGLNAAHGHDTMVAPADRLLSNSESIFKFAAGREKMRGGLLTSWEKTDTFLYRSMLIFAADGFMMNGENCDAAFAKAVKLIFNSDDPVLTAALHNAMDLGMLRHFDGLQPSFVFSRDFGGLSPEKVTSCASTRAILKAVRPVNMSELAARVYDDIQDAMDDKMLAFRAQTAAQDIFSYGWTAERQAEFAAVRTEYRDFMDRMESRWERNRPGVTPNFFAEKRGKVDAMLGDMEKRLASKAWVQFSGCLPDGYGVEQILVEYKTGGEWFTAGKGVFKPIDLATGLFSRYLPLEKDPEMPVEELRVTTWGLGGVGVTFLDAFIGGVHYVPASLLEVSGRVNNPAYVLKQDSTVSWFGGQSTRDDYYDVHAARVRSSVTVAMKPYSYEKSALVR